MVDGGGLSNNVNASVPFKNVSRREKRLLAKPWLSRGLVNSIKRKNKLFIELQKCFNMAAFNDYKKYRNSLNRVIKTAKQNYDDEPIEANKNNQDQIWKIVQCLAQLKSKTKTLPTELKVGDKELLDDQEAICYEFNQFFANIGNNLSDHLINNREVTTKNSFFFTPITFEEVATVIRSLKAKKSIRENDISIKFLKYSTLILSPYFGNLFNLLR